MSSKVYFTNNLSADGLQKVFDALNIKFNGKLAVKVHSGEKGNQNFLRPEFFKDFLAPLNGTIVECNTAYDGARNTTEKHKELIKEHGWDSFFPVDIMDEDGSATLNVENGKFLKENLVGKHLLDYDSLLVLSHFKGHPMGGFGGALKQLSIGCASTAGKCWIHSAGTNDDQAHIWEHIAKQDDFIDSMAEAASTVDKLFRGNVAYINVMCNMSVDCDCCAVAENPCVKDIGILASTDPVAIDQACIDLVFNSNDAGRNHFVERVESRNGRRILESAEKLGVGSRIYELIELE